MEADLRLGKFSESCNQGVVIFCVCRLYGHVNDVDWVLPLILEGMGAKSAAARKRKTKAFSCSQQRSPWSCPPHTDWRTLNTEPSPRAAPRSWRELHQNSCKRQKGKHQQAATLFIYLYQNKNQRKFIYHQVQSDLLKSSTHWKATMAPIRWQGGDNDPSRKSSLLCRLILNCPDPLTGTGTLETRQTHRLWQQRQKDRMTPEKTLNRTEHWSPDQVWPP